MSKPFSLSKHERLKSKKQIDALFLSGEAFFVFPYKVKYKIELQQDISELKFAISVPKRNFKRAVDRNRLKRMSREAYRINKVSLKNNLALQNSSLQLMFIFTHKEIVSYSEIEKAVINCLAKIIKQISPPNDQK